MIELVWDLGHSGTATSPSGATVSVGGGTQFSPDELLATAVASSVMGTFLDLAREARCPILSYVATAHGELSLPASPLVVHVYLLAPAGADARALADLCTRSAQMSPVAQRLALPPTVTCEVRVLCHSHRAGAGEL
jgi:hypothetical protein